MRNLFLLFILLFFLSFSNQNKISVDFIVLKKSTSYFVTSGIVPTKETLNYEKSKSKKTFYGRYYFTNRKKTKEGVNYILIINDSIKPWKYTSKTEKFIEITCLNGDENIIPEIKISNGIKEIEAKLGKPKLINNNYYIFSFKNQFFSFYVTNNKITKYRIGYYNSATLNGNLTLHLSDF